MAKSFIERASKLVIVLNQVSILGLQARYGKSTGTTMSAIGSTSSAMIYLNRTTSTRYAICYSDIA